MTESENNSERADSPSVYFDPLALGPEHGRHAQSTSILRISDSGRVFCPLCLDKIPSDRLKSVSDILFDRYIWNLLEILENYQSRNQLRRLVLAVLERITKRRSLKVKSDQDLHNLLHIFYKSISNNQTSLDEFSSISIILSRITEEFKPRRTASLVSLWTATKSMLDYAETRFSALNHSSLDELNHELGHLVESCSVIIKMYLGVIKQTTIDRVPEHIFYINQNDPFVASKYYYDSQIQCIKFISSRLVSSIWPFLTTTQRTLKPREIDVISELFTALQESLLAAIRLTENNLIGFLNERDAISVVHCLISNNKSRAVRTNFRLFLREFILYQVSLEYGHDEELLGMFDPVETVETNHRNAIAFSGEQSKNVRTIFYLIVNQIAKKFNSRYFQANKVKKVMKAIDPEKLNLGRSKVSWKIFCQLAASIVPRVGILDSIEHFMSERWKKMRPSSNVDRNETGFEEEFCHSEAFFFWAYEHPDFVVASTTKTIERVAEICIRQGTINNLFKKLLDKKHYKILVRIYLSDHDSAISTIEEIVRVDHDSDTQLDSNTCHEALMTKLSAIIPALLHNSVLNSVIHLDEHSHLGTVQRLLKMVMIALNNCPHFNLDLDEQFIIDFFKLFEKLYSEKPTPRTEEALLALNQLMKFLIRNNDPKLMTILKYLEHSVMGYMFHHLSDYTREDKLGESIAGLLVAYDELDYPLVMKLTDGLRPLALSATNWMLSSCQDLHTLSMKVVEKVLEDNRDPESRICIATGLLNMLASNPSMIEVPTNWQIFSNAIRKDEILYNPTTKYLLRKLPDWVSYELENIQREKRGRPPSPTLSFGNSDDQSSTSGEIRTAVTDILGQLDSDDPDDLSCSSKVPKSLYASNFLRDQHSRKVNSGDWENLAYQMNNNGEPF